MTGRSAGKAPRFGTAGAAGRVSAARLLAGRLVAWVRDYAYIVRWQVQGFVLRQDPSAYLSPPPSAPPRIPVVLIPGVYENWQFLRPLAVYLSERGHPVHTVAPLGYNRGRIEDMARLVETYLREEAVPTAAIVAHSKGGLVGKQVMTGPEGARVSHMVAVNTPFAGSVYARFFLTPTIRAFSPRNPFLRRLQASRDANARITSVYASFDPHIPGGSGLEGARNVVLEAMGHFRPIGDERLHRIVAEELAVLEESAGPDEPGRPAVAGPAESRQGPPAAPGGGPQQGARRDAGKGDPGKG